MKFTPEDEYYGRAYYESLCVGGGHLHWSALPDTQRAVWVERAKAARAIPAYVAPVDPVVELAKQLRYVYLGYPTSGRTTLENTHEHYRAAWLRVAQAARDFCAKPTAAQTEITAQTEFKVGDRVVFRFKGYSGRARAVTITEVLNDRQVRVAVWDLLSESVCSVEALCHANEK